MMLEVGTLLTLIDIAERGRTESLRKILFLGNNAEPKEWKDRKAEIIT